MTTHRYEKSVANEFEAERGHSELSAQPRAASSSSSAKMCLYQNVIDWT